MPAPLRKVVVPLDGSSFAERALAPATEIARHVSGQVVPMVVDGFEHHDELRAYVDCASEPFAADLAEPYLVEAPDAALCIANAGEAEDTLIVMTSHGRGGIRRAELGSVAEKVLRTLHRPVMIVGPHHQDWRNLVGGTAMIPLDGSETADLVVPSAIEWCRRLDLAARTVTVIDPAQATDGDQQVSMEAAHVRAVSRDLAEAGVEASWVVLHHREAAAPLATFSWGLPAAVVILSTHGRSGARRAVLGSVAARLVHDAACPVLALNPDLEPDPGAETGAD